MLSQLKASPWLDCRGEREKAERPGEGAGHRPGGGRGGAGEGLDCVLLRAGEFIHMSLNWASKNDVTPFGTGKKISMQIVCPSVFAHGCVCQGKVESAQRIIYCSDFGQVAPLNFLGLSCLICEMGT